MFLNKNALILLAFGVTSCGTVRGVTSEPHVLHGPYDRLAACVYDRLTKEDSTGVRLTDLRGINAVEINHINGEVELWSARFYQAGKDETKLEMRGLPTVRGSEFYQQELLGLAQQCI